MNDETTLKIKQFIVDEFMPDVSVDELDSDFDLLTGGVVDSLGLLQVVAWLETEFDVAVDDSELGPESFRTVDAIKEYVEKAKAGGGADGG
jgi:acyl carrier protein